MYEDKLDGLIDEKMYLDKVKDYKARQVEITEQMTRHEKADHNFYVTANMVMNLAARAREIFESSEVDEKRQLLNLVFQNFSLEESAGFSCSTSVFSGVWVMNFSSITYWKCIKTRLLCLPL